MLTEQERKWLENRTPVCCELIPPKSFDGKPQSRCPDCKYNLPPGQCSIHHSDYRDAAEFEARVAEKLTLKEPCPLPENADLDDCPYFIEDEESAFSCRWCRLKRARIAVEEEMDECLSPRL